MTHYLMTLYHNYKKNCWQCTLVKKVHSTEDIKSAKVYAPINQLGNLIEYMDGKQQVIQIDLKKKNVFNDDKSVT